MTDKIYPIGQLPKIGEIPELMYAATLRKNKYGEPKKAFTIEKVPVPVIGKNEVLIAVMAAGVNYDGVWAALGKPVDIIKQNQRKGYKEEYQICGSDASGIVWKIGEKVTNVKIGDEVVISCGVWNINAKDFSKSKTPMESNSSGIWGYDTNYGSFAQFSLVKDFQCYSKPKHLSWEESSAYMLTGATAYRQLMGFSPNIVSKNTPVLIWGGAGGLGSMAIQITAALKGKPIAVVSSKEKEEYCKKIGAIGTINRKKYSHWGRLPNINNEIEMNKWTISAKKILSEFQTILKDNLRPMIVFEHSGEDTIPTSVFMCGTGGMIVICGGTSGYNADVDLRYLWVKQKRLQGSHFANPSDCEGINHLVKEKKIKPMISKIYKFNEIGVAHQKLKDNKNHPGQMTIQVGSKK
ncbi:MAG: crotonyl-CoA carboxylase/reductase [Chloroflexi bacterium]|jgi:crotonyl-CoA carboxylase/reductase|nr:MAG: crotonyl-CoA carboxylase/reductase [Chloroflexota bacterium]|tara:strand:- start:6783 stop:8006 length:1224 start_codon:yes stop_codon:yes gene_type:complete